MASLGGLPTPLVVMCAGGMLSALLLLQALQKWKLGFLVFLYLTVHKLPQLRIHPAIFSPLEFLCIPLLEEAFVQLQALQKESQVSGPIK